MTREQKLAGGKDSSVESRKGGDVMFTELELQWLRTLVSQRIEQLEDKGGRQDKINAYEALYHKLQVLAKQEVA